MRHGYMLIFPASCSRHWEEAFLQLDELFGTSRRDKKKPGRGPKKIKIRDSPLQRNRKYTGTKLGNPYHVKISRLLSSPC